MDEQQWNAFAAEYAKIQQESRLPLATTVVAQLTQWYPLRQWTVADIAAGSGRYSLPLAQTARAVVVNDWAQQMLIEAKQHLAPANLTNLTYLQADWRKLPAQPLADLIFVSQLPALQADQLSKLDQLAKRAVAIHYQLTQTNSLLTALATALNEPEPTVAQADPARHGSYGQAARKLNPTARYQQFTYQLTEQTTVAELLPRFNRPIGAVTAQHLAEDIAHVTNVTSPVETHLTYQYELLTWRH